VSIAVPFHIPGVELAGGAFVSPLAALAGLVAEIFGQNSDWSPASEEVFFDFGRVPENAHGRGSAPWSFLVFRILVRRKSSGAFAAAVTHAFVDRHRAAMLGREVFGFPALPATFSTLPAGENLDTVLARGGTVEVTTDVLGDAPNVSPGIIARFTLGPPGKDARSSAGSHWVWEELRRSVSASTGARVPFAQFKQLRDAIDPTRACFQEVIEGTLETKNARDSEPAKAEIQLWDFRSFELAKPLGQRSSEVAPARDGYRSHGVQLSFEIGESTRTEPVSTGRNGAPFRFRSGDPQFAPDYEFHNVTLTGFKVPANRERVKSLVDRLLNAPFPRRDYKYEPTSADIIVEYLRYGSMVSANPPLGLRAGDSAGQQELLFRILVGRVDQGSKVPQRPAMFCPFLFVDSAWSFISGREIIGYPKQLGVFDHHEEDGDVAGGRVRAHDKNGVEAHVLTFDCRAGERVETMDAVLDRPRDTRVSPGSRAVASPISQFTDHPWWGLADLQGLADLNSFVRPWLNGSASGYGAIQLKRFAEAHPTENACYIEVLEGDYTVRNVQGTLPLYRASLVFPPDDPFEIKEAFGLNQSILVPAGSWYRATCDFRLRIRDPLA
jgi:hypothetical protein